MELRPYNFNPRNRHRITEQFRLGLDLLVVTVYAYLLLAITELKHAPLPSAMTTTQQQLPSRGVGSFLIGFRCRSSIHRK